MNTPPVDVAIVGAGTAGMAAYRAARAHTERVLLIEAGPGGTTCAREGCMPSKLLIAAADAAHAIAQAPHFGVHGGAPRVDGAAVMARVRSERDRFVGFVLETFQSWPDAHRLTGTARLLAPGQLEVDGQRIDARAVVWATGSAPHVEPAWRAALGERLITSEAVFDWTDLPASVAVLGTGTIAIELAQALHRLGVRVRVFGRSPRVGPLTDPVLQALAVDVFSQELSLTLSPDPLQLSRDGDQAVVRGEHFDWVLAATGRSPNLAGLVWPGLARDTRGRLPYDPATGQVADLPLFLAGDVSEHRPLLHEAADAGRIAGDNAARWPDVQAQPHRTALGVVFSEPQMMLAGASHRALTQAGQPFATGRVSFANQGRSRVMLHNVGALHVYGEPGSGRFLGAEMLGPAAEHIGHLLAWSAQRGDTVEQMLAYPYYHPVIEEGLRTALQDLQMQIKA